MNQKILRTVGCLLVMCCLMGCGQSSKSELMVTVSEQCKTFLERPKKVPVLPFIRGESVPDHTETLWTRVAVKDAGDLVSDMFAAELMRLPNVRLVERSQIKVVLEEQRLSFSDLIENKSASQIGKLLNVDAVLVGHVPTCYRLDAALMRDYCEYAYSARLVETSSGEVLMGASVSEVLGVYDVIGACRKSVQAAMMKVRAELDH